MTTGCIGLAALLVVGLLQSGTTARASCVYNFTDVDFVQFDLEAGLFELYTFKPPPGGGNCVPGVGGVYRLVTELADPELGIESDEGPTLQVDDHGYVAIFRPLLYLLRACSYTNSDVEQACIEHNLNDWLPDQPHD